MFKIIANKSIFLILLIWNSVAFTHEFKKNHVEIVHPMISTPFPEAISAAGYMKIVNNGEKKITLVAVSTNIGRAMIHETVMGSKGVLKMVPTPQVSIPAGHTFIFQYGQFHIMFTELDQRLNTNDLIPATLLFSDNSKINIEFKVEKPEHIMKKNTHMTHPN